MWGCQQNIGNYKKDSFSSAGDHQMLICKRTTLTFLWQGHLVQTVMFSGNCLDSLTMSSPKTKCYYMRGITPFNLQICFRENVLKRNCGNLTPTTCLLPHPKAPPLCIFYFKIKPYTVHIGFVLEYCEPSLHDETPPRGHVNSRLGSQEITKVAWPSSYPKRTCHVPFV